MRITLAVLSTLFFSTSWAQQDSATYRKPVKNKHPQQHPVTATLSFGFADAYKNAYSLPQGYLKNNTSGYSLYYGKLEYALSRDVGLAATMVHDAFTYNYSKEFTGNNGEFVRYKTDNFRLWGGGLTGFYHFRRLMRIKHLDPFAGLGVSLNNVRYGAYPQGDTAGVKLLHTATPYLKAGARYYLSDMLSLYGDVGYDKQSVFSLGLSCRFGKKHPHPFAGKNDNTTFKPDTTIIPIALPVKHICIDTAIDTAVNVTVDRRYGTNFHKNIPLLDDNTIQFQFDKFYITQSSYSMLDDAAKILEENPDYYLRIDGYADITGTAAVNKRISLKRAETVKKYLAGKGIEAGRLVTKGYGSRNPVATNHTKAGRAKNRRVIISLEKR